MCVLEPELMDIPLWVNFTLKNGFTTEQVNFVSPDMPLTVTTLAVSCNARTVADLQILLDCLLLDYYASSRCYFQAPIRMLPWAGKELFNLSYPVNLAPFEPHSAKLTAYDRSKDGGTGENPVPRQPAPLKGLSEPIELFVCLTAKIREEPVTSAEKEFKAQSSQTA